MKIRPYKGVCDKRMAREIMLKDHGSISLLKDTRITLNRRVRRRSKRALSLCRETGGAFDQNDFLVGGVWVY